MKLARTLSLLTLAGGTVAAILAAQGCSSSSTTTEPLVDGGGSSSNSKASGSKGSSNSGGSSEASSKSSGGSSVAASSSATTSAPDAGDVGQPPQPTGQPTKSTSVHNFAIHNLYIGDTDPTPSFTLNAKAWQTLGYNLDHKVSTAASKDVCTPFQGSTAAQQDGANGIDNAFGEVIVSQLGSIAGNLSQKVSTQIAGGSFTIEIDTTGLDATMANQSATALTGQLFAGAKYEGDGGVPPLKGTNFALTDNWAVSEALLANGHTIAGGSKIKFPQAYVTNNTWVSGSPIDLSLSISLLGETLSLTIHSALMSFDYAVVGGQGLATKGIIAGVLQYTELDAAINQILGNLQMCGDTTIVKPLLEKAQDMIINGDTISNVAGTACNGISIGLGFDADEIAAPSVVAAPTDAGAAAAPCPG